MKEFYIRFIENRITYVYRTKDFTDLWTVEADIDLVYEIENYQVDKVDEDNRTCIVSKKI